MNTEEFIERSIAVHGNIYGYAYVEYFNYSTEVMIICPKHSAFEQLPGSHLNGHGCKKCADLNKGYHRLNFYKKNSKKGQELGHYYQIRLFNETESFYKIGITSLNIKKRYQASGTGIYNYEIINDIVMTNLKCALREKEDAKKFKSLKYVPKDKTWGGYTECYKERLEITG